MCGGGGGLGGDRQCKTSYVLHNLLFQQDFQEDVPLEELCTLYLHACQV